MLVSEIRDDVRNTVGDRGGIFVTNDLVILWINEAIAEIFRRTDIAGQQIDEVTLSAGNPQWTPTNLLRVNNVFNKNTETPLSEKEFQWITDFFGPSYYLEQDVPQFYFNTIESGANSLTFVPTPSQDVTLVIYWVQFPEPLTSQSDEVSDVVPLNMQYDIIRYCVMRAHEKEKDFRASEKAQQHFESNLENRRQEAHRTDDSYGAISPDPFDYI